MQVRGVAGRIRIVARGAAKLLVADSGDADKFADLDVPLGKIGVGDRPTPEGWTAYVCGSAGFAEAASRLLVDFGVPASDVRVERFGPSG